MVVIPLSLYIHWPWCLKKCPYCDFNSHAIGQQKVEQRWLKAIERQMVLLRPQAAGRGLISVFIGGGTPSLMSPVTLKAVLEAAKENFGFLPQAEITLEANPGTFEQEKFQAFRDAGVTRLSLGVQSFSDRFLKVLGRVHNAKEAQLAAQSAREIFPELSLDLMFGLPGQTLEDLQADIEAALAVGTSHLSYYQLTIEDNTLFASRTPLGLPDEDLLQDMQQLVEQRLSEQGLERYEVSSFCRVGHECRHNKNYWTFGDYLAVGPGAHGKITRDGVVRRFEGFRTPARWMASLEAGEDGCSHQRVVDQAQLPFEFMLNALRLRRGVKKSLWTERSGLPFSEIAPVWEQGVRLGLLAPAQQRLQCTEKGWLFLNDAVELFL